jgi:hypothetical protein
MSKRCEKKALSRCLAATVPIECMKMKIPKVSAKCGKVRKYEVDAGSQEGHKPKCEDFHHNWSERATCFSHIVHAFDEESAMRESES